MEGFVVHLLDALELLELLEGGRVLHHDSALLHLHEAPVVLVLEDVVRAALQHRQSGDARVGVEVVDVLREVEGGDLRELVDLVEGDPRLVQLPRGDGREELHKVDRGASVGVQYVKALLHLGVAGSEPQDPEHLVRLFDVQMAASVSVGVVERGVNVQHNMHALAHRYVLHRPRGERHRSDLAVRHDELFTLDHLAQVRHINDHLERALLDGVGAARKRFAEHLKLLILGVHVAFPGAAGGTASPRCPPLARGGALHCHGDMLEGGRHVKS
mmetsp:Transcript_69383/g.219555  ORF Transcript_69383/g.219555 Transcript_69383/m.219555 type:complete len:272 (+) Transcript_69383:1418-2233(+)